MSENVRSQAQQISDFWSKAFTDQAARIEAVYGEIDEIQAKNIAQAGANFDEAARLARESMVWGAAIASAYRRIALDSMKKVAEATTGMVAKA